MIGLQLKPTACSLLPILASAWCLDTGTFLVHVHVHPGTNPDFTLLWHVHSMVWWLVHDLYQYCCGIIFIFSYPGLFRVSTSATRSQPRNFLFYIIFSKFVFWQCVMSFRLRLPSKLPSKRQKDHQPSPSQRSLPSLTYHPPQWDWITVVSSSGSW